MEHLDNVKNIKQAAQRIMAYGYVDYRGRLITSANVRQFQGKLTLTAARNHLSEVFQGK